MPPVEGILLALSIELCLSLREWTSLSEYNAVKSESRIPMNNSDCDSVSLLTRTRSHSYRDRTALQYYCGHSVSQSDRIMVGSDLVNSLNLILWGRENT